MSDAAGCPLGNPAVCECKRYGKNKADCRFREGATMTKREGGDELTRMVTAAIRAKEAAPCAPN